MKRLSTLGLLGVAGIAAIGIFLLLTSRSSPPVPSAAFAVAHPVDETQRVAVPEPTPLAMQYYRSGNWLWILAQAWAILLPATLAFSGASARLRDVATKLGRRWFFTVGLFVVMYLAIVFLMSLPFTFYLGYARQHAYGMSNQTVGRWLGNSLIGLGVDAVIAFLFAWVPYLLIAKSPRRWWIYTAAVVIPFLFAGAFIKPIWIDPLFNHFGPMKNKALEQSILSLAARAGIEGSRVFEVDKSVDTRAVNAYVTGLFDTKRIVLWDTIIARLDENELLVVMGHEMGHYVLGHVARSILLSSVVILAGLYLVDRLGRRCIARFSGRLGFDSLADVASVPLLLMLIEVSMLLLSPVAMAYSRFQEHEADRFALELTHMNYSGAMAFVTLQTENLGNPRPDWFFRLLRSTHPSTGERIDFCNQYRPWFDGPANAESTRSLDR
jgi:Zn-dependent protease with chaperone function